MTRNNKRKAVVIDLTTPPPSPKRPARLTLDPLSQYLAQENGLLTTDNADLRIDRDFFREAYMDTLEAYNKLQQVAADGYNRMQQALGEDFLESPDEQIENCTVALTEFFHSLTDLEDFNAAI